MRHLPKRPLFCIWLTLLLSVAVLQATASRPFFFIQLSDPQFGMFTENTNFVQETANFEFAIATVNRLRPAFVVVTGDLVHKPGDAAQIAEYRRIVARIDPAIPVYHVAGNHDVGNVPTPASVAGYTNQFGADHYSFRHDGFVGIVLDSSLVHSPQLATADFEAQDHWLRGELERVRSQGARHLVVFQHHPWFLASSNERDQYFNIPLERRARYLALFREYGVKYLFCGHYHRNVVARDQDLEVIVSGPVGKPLGEGKSGLGVVIVRDSGLEYHYYDFGRVPNSIDLDR